MRTIVLILSSMALAMAATAGSALPPGMARADDPQQVAKLYSEERKQEIQQQRKEAAAEDRLTAAEEYQLKLIAYRTQLVEEQRQRKIKELELELEREARLRAEKAAAIAERERRRESIYIQHHSVHAFQRNLNDEYWREQRLLRALEQKHHHHQPCAQPSPSPAPQPAPAAQMMVSSKSSSEEEGPTGNALP